MYIKVLMKRKLNSDGLNSTKINKANNQLWSMISEYIKDLDIWKFRSLHRTGIKCDGVKLVNRLLFDNLSWFSKITLILSYFPSILSDSDTIRIYSGICLIRHTKGPGKCVGLYRMSKYSGFSFVHRNTLGP